MESAEKRTRRFEPKLEEGADYFARLGVRRGASQAEINAAFRDVSKRFHLDAGGDAEKMKLASEAFSELKDPDKRAAYTADLFEKEAAAEEAAADIPGEEPRATMSRMGLDKLWQARNRRFNDPSFRASLDGEWDRVRESWGRMGHQTKATCTSILYNTVVRPFVRVRHGRKLEFAPAKQVVAGAVESTAATLVLVARILMASGRLAKYGARWALAA